MKDYKLLETYQTEFEAELVQTKLDRLGISAMLQAEDRSNVLPSIDYSNGYHVYVNPEDYDRAIALISSSSDALGDDMDTNQASNGVV